MRSRSALLFVLILLAVGAALVASAARSPKAKIEKHSGGVRIFFGHDLFTDYRTDLGPKPILWPIRNAAGVEITRAFPMEMREGEKRDHPHQRSLWFTFGKVNGIDFWTETPGHGVIRQLELVRAEVVRGVPVLVTRNDWLGPDGVKHCEDERTLRFGESEGIRWIDFDIRLIASAGDVTFGDTKEGMFGLRVPTWMDVGGKNKSRILNSEGQENAAAWGKPARWVDYRGARDGVEHGVVIFDSPESFRHPARWHVRPYGLFAANPFGLHDFTGEGDGSHTIASGRDIHFRYRVLFYTGDRTVEQIENDYAAFANLSE